MFGSTLRRARSNRERRTTSEILTGWLVRARLGGSVPTGQLGHRRARRWNWKCKLWAQIGSEWHQIRAYDLSASGAGLLLPRKLERGAHVRVGAAPSGPTVDARVMHVSGPDKHGQFRTGVQFLISVSHEPHG